jgi:hypothetical protein
MLKSVIDIHTRIKDHKLLILLINVNNSVVAIINIKCKRNYIEYVEQ